MPMFVEGQDPRDQPQGAPDAPAAAPDPFASPQPGAILGAAMRQANPIVSVVTALNAASPDRTPDPDWNPLSLIRGTPYEQAHLQDFLGDQNESQTRARMAQINAEEADRQTLAASGWAGTVASVGAGLTDPTMYLPVIGEAAKGIGVARTALSTAGRMAVTGALSSAASEGLLQASQQTRPGTESLGNIASGTLLMGLLGAGAGALMSRGEAKAAASDLDSVRKDFSSAPADVAATANAGLGLPADAGAAIADVRQLKLKNYGVPDWLKNTPYAGPAAEAVGDVLNKLSPTLRVFSSDSVVAKRAMADLAETPLVFEDNAKGITTSFGAPPLDRLIRTQSDQLKMGANAALEDAFIDYRYGATPPKMAMQQAAVSDLRGQSNGLMSFGDFKAQVSQALYSGDVHGVPQVQRAARELRRGVFDRVSKLAQDTMGPDGKPMLAEELAPPRGDQSYAPRVWNKEAIAARRNELHGTFTDWLQSEQATKAAAKDRLSALQARHEELGGQVAKLDGRLETVRGRQEDTTSRIAERAMEVSKAEGRSDTVEARGGAIRDALSEVEEFISSMRGELKSPEALSRIDELEQYRDLLRGQMTGAPRAQKAEVEARETQELQALMGDRQDIRAAVAAAREDRAGSRSRLRVAAAREDEAGIAANRSTGRLGILQGRLTRQQIVEDLLEQARGNAESERLALRGKMEQELRDWKGNSTSEAVAALKARDEASRLRGLKQDAGAYEGKGERLAAADGPVDRAVKKIIDSDRDLSRQDHASIADQIIDRILGSPDGRLSYDSKPTVGPPAFGSGQQVSGHLKSRDFAIPTAQIKDFVEKDTQHLVSSYLRSVLPDVMLTQRFGDIEMRDVFRRLNEEYAAKVKATSSERAASALEKQRQGMIRDLAATRDRVRGVYGWSPDPRMRNAARVANVARNWNVIADLGTSVANRLGDAGANAVFRHGFMNVMHDAWRPMLKAMVGQRELASAYRVQAKAMAVGVDGMLGHMAHDFGDVVDNYRPGSKFERGLAWAADRSMLVNMHGPWTDWTKTMVSGVASAEVLRASERVAANKASAKDIERLAAANIDRPMATRIHDNFTNGGGSMIDGTPVPNTRDWKDLSARTAFEAAIGREANIAVITPGLEKPLWMSGPIAGLAGQFKSFVSGAYERLLIANLQQRDARTLQGLLTAVATGMVSYRLYSWLSGHEVSDNPADWIKEGVHRSAILSWLSEANEMQAKFTGGASDMYRLIGASSPLTRHDHSSFSELLGPTYARLEGLTGALGDATRAVLPGDKPHAVWSAQDTHKLRELMLFQNLFAVRRLFDQAESGINSAIGIPQRPPPGKKWQ